MTYKSCRKAVELNKAAYTIAHKLGLDDRMERLQNSEAYITAKDHKENFNSNPSFRLINPSKTDIGKVSKVILDKINKELLAKTKVNQWKSTKAAIDWFKGINNKKKCKFLKFDIVNFYPSINEEILEKFQKFRVFPNETIK